MLYIIAIKSLYSIVAYGKFMLIFWKSDKAMSSLFDLLPDIVAILVAFIYNI